MVRLRRSSSGEHKSKRKRPTGPWLVQSLLAIVVALAPASLGLGQELPADSKSAFDTISKRSVTATINFLASDEMRGRDTPSPELKIASAYVAARFKAAGLEGLGDKGTFFQTSEIATTAVPTSGIKMTSDGRNVEHFGLLSADSDSVSFEGKVQLVTGKQARNATFDGPITFVADEFKGPRDPSNFNRKLARYRRAGATAIFVQVDEKHLLVGAAKRANQPKLVQTRGGIAGHVLLIPKMELGEVRFELPKQIGGKDSVRNVVGVLRGSDPELSKEAIIITAHLDHIGQQGVVGDTICNGADDNATGVTAVVSLADAFGVLAASEKKRGLGTLKRSVIFMTFWGEEKGKIRPWENHERRQQAYWCADFQSSAIRWRNVVSGQ